MTRVSKDDWVPQGVGGLEDRAWVALRETDRSVLVTAGAGAGKLSFWHRRRPIFCRQVFVRPPNVFWPSALKKMLPETLQRGFQNVVRGIKPGVLIQ